MTLSIAAASESEPSVNNWGQFTFENDAFGVAEPTDDGYSNGIGYVWGSTDIASFDKIDMPDWLRSASGWSYINQAEQGQYSVSYGIIQGMFTPSDLDTDQLVVDDRPYAGVLLWQAKLRHYDNDIATSLALNLGVVGPASLAQETQSMIHAVIDARDPQGWDNQLENEPVFRSKNKNASSPATTPSHHRLRP